MAHMLIPIKCKKGHSDLSITLDNNECGCHHEGKPCLIISCHTCFEEALKNNTPINLGKIYISLNPENIKELEKL